MPQIVNTQKWETHLGHLIDSSHLLDITDITTTTTKTYSWGESWQKQHIDKKIQNA